MRRERSVPAFLQACEQLVGGMPVGASAGVWMWRIVHVCAEQALRSRDCDRSRLLARPSRGEMIAKSMPAYQQT